MYVGLYCSSGQLVNLTGHKLQVINRQVYEIAYEGNQVAKFTRYIHVHNQWTA
jgi:hypothetical protein